MWTIFSTKPPRPGVPAVVTTIEAINSTGALRAFSTGGNHVLVIPINGSVTTWMEQGEFSTWTNVLSNCVSEIYGGP